MTFEVVAADGNKCGEGPIWDYRDRRLLWDDLGSNLVFEYVPATGAKRVLSRDVNASAIALNRTGELVLVGSGGVHLWKDGACRTLAGGYNFNDAIADPRGRVYAGTYHWGPNGMERHGALHVITGAGRVGVADEGIELSNGLGFSPDDRTLYFADTVARRIYAYDYRAETGQLLNRRIFVRVPREDGLPDGLTVDREGFVWCAMWYGGQVVRYDPDGKVERRLKLPALQVSSVAFGGDGGDELYVTTASDPWPSEYAPPGFDFKAPHMGGSLYRGRPGVQGKPEHLAELR